jgi:hypothetical protein
MDCIKYVGKLTAKKLLSANIVVVSDLLNLMSPEKIIQASSKSTILVKRINNILYFTRASVIMTTSPAEVNY